MLNSRGAVRRIVIHVMTVADLRRAAVPAAVMRDDAIALRALAVFKLITSLYFVSACTGRSSGSRRVRFA